LEISSDDYVAVIGTTDKNVHFSLNLDYLSKIPLRQVVVQTELKTIYADLIGGKLKEQTASGELKTKSFACSNRDLTYENMHHAILNGRIESLCSYEEGVAVMRAIEAIRQSSGLKD
jgi:predicted dehydrogenase